jgi:hypothetical protein
MKIYTHPKLRFFLIIIIFSLFTTKNLNASIISGLGIGYKTTPIVDLTFLGDYNKFDFFLSLGASLNTPPSNEKQSYPFYGDPLEAELSTFYYITLGSTTKVFNFLNLLYGINCNFRQDYLKFYNHDPFARLFHSNYYIDNGSSINFGFTFGAQGNLTDQLGIYGLYNTYLKTISVGLTWDIEKYITHSQQDLKINKLKQDLDLNK